MKQYEVDKVLCEEVIITTQTRRGFGQKLSPIRVITEVFSKTGEKIAEHDPCKEKDTFVALDLVHFAQWCIGKGYVNASKMSIDDVVEWVNSIELKISNDL